MNISWNFVEHAEEYRLIILGDTTITYKSFTNHIVVRLPCDSTSADVTIIAINSCGNVSSNINIMINKIDSDMQGRKQ